MASKSERGPAYEVAAFPDLAGARISSAGKDRVLAALEDHEAVLFLEDWLRSEKPLGTLPGTQGLYACTVAHRTDAAWCVEQPEGDEVWVPKSSAELYERHEDGLENDSGSPQQSLREWSE